MRIWFDVEIYGHVQGVWYRAWTEREVNSRSSDGWVRNRQEGWVEALLAGAKSQVNGMIEICRSGPLADSVVEIKLLKAVFDDVGFSVLPTV